MVIEKWNVTALLPPRHRRLALARMALSQDKSIAHRQFHIAHWLAGRPFPNPSPCESMGNARCAMANESGLEDLLNSIGFVKPD
jgi:hypothetical protein